jgi:hypothetical protein
MGAAAKGADERLAVDHAHASCHAMWMMTTSSLRHSAPAPIS